MNERRWAILFPDTSNGCDIIGPFPNEAAATTWAERQEDDGDEESLRWTTVELFAPRPLPLEALRRRSAPNR